MLIFHTLGDREIKISKVVWLRLFEQWASLTQEQKEITIKSLYLKIQKENYSLLVNACKLVFASMSCIILVGSC